MEKCPECGQEAPCPTCGTPGDYLTGEPRAERIHYFARCLWSLHKLRQNLQASDSTTLAEEASDIIHRIDRLQELAAGLDVH
jgi:hypothetical protein